MEHFKRSTERDFKIDGQTVQAKRSENMREQSAKCKEYQLCLSDLQSLVPLLFTRHCPQILIHLRGNVLYLVTIRKWK